MNPDQVQKLIEDMDAEVTEIKKSSLSFAWYMRGGVSYEDALNMSTVERNAMSELINNNLEVTKKSQLPFF